MAPKILLRTVLLLLLFTCNACLYLARTNITVAVIYMFPQSENIEGDLLSAFYWGYMVSQIPGGYLASSFGAKRVLGSAVLVWGLSTTVTGFVGTSIPILFCLRAFVGVAEGANYPSQMDLISKWIPHQERSRAWSFVISGESLGTILALLGGPYLAHSCGWKSIFWVSGGASLVWLLLFLLLTTSTPADHPWMTNEELLFIQETRPPPSSAGRQQQEIKRTTPWCDILTNKRMVVIVCTHCCYNFGYYLCLSWIQKFFSICYHATYQNLGILSILPYLATFLCLTLAGQFSDWVEVKFQWSATTVRKIFNTIGMVGSSFFFLLLSFHAPTSLPSSSSQFSNSSIVPSSSSSLPPADMKDAEIAAILLACAIGVGSFAAGAGYWPSLGDLSVEYSSVVCGVSNSVASIPGVIGGQLVGRLLVSTGNDWSFIFQMAAGVELVGALIFLIGGSAEDQNFGQKKTEMERPLVDAVGEFM